MRRKLFTLAAGVSAALCVGVCVLWIGGYQVAAGHALGDVGRRSSSGGVLTVNAILYARGHAEFVHAWASRASLPPWLRPGWFYRTDMDVDPQTDRDSLWG